MLGAGEPLAPAAASLGNSDGRVDGVPGVGSNGDGVGGMVVGVATIDMLAAVCAGVAGAAA